MLKRFFPPNYDHLFLSDSETESEDGSYYLQDDSKVEMESKRSNKKTTHANGESMEEAFKEEPEIAHRVIGEAKKYQECMRQLPVPIMVESPPSIFPFIAWQDLAKTMKKKYGQPLHYLTHTLLKQWDESRVKTNYQINPIGNVINPTKAETTVWVVEEYHRQFASHDYIAKLWNSDPHYHYFVDDEGIPKF